MTINVANLEEIFHLVTKLRLATHWQCKLLLAETKTPSWSLSSHCVTQLELRNEGKNMNQHTDRVKEPDMLAEYDFSSGVRGMYADRFKGIKSDVVVLAPDVAEVFGDSKSVNEALRVIAKLAGKHAKKSAA
jgi:hypothetical protein